MISGLLLGAAAVIAFIGVVAPYYFWRVAKEKSMTLRQVQLELDQTRQELRELIDGPPMPSDNQLGTHLALPAARLTTTIEDLEELHKSSSEPLAAIVIEAQEATHVDRKARFDGYRDALTTATTQIAATQARLRSSLGQCVAVSEALSKDELGIHAGHSLASEIIRVLERSNSEYSVDDVSLASKRFIHLDHARTARERIEARSNNELAVRRRALTALEKFRAIKPTGSRGGFSAENGGTWANS